METWEGAHNTLQARIARNERSLDVIAKAYEKEYNAVISQAYNAWANDGILDMDNLSKPITIKQKQALNKKMTKWIDSGDYLADKQFITKLNRLISKPTVRRSEVIEIGLRRVSSQLKTSQRPKIVNSLYNTWLDSERTVARITNRAFTMTGDDVIYRSINKSWDGSNLISRLYNQAGAITKQMVRQMVVAVNKGVGVNGLKRIVDYMFSDGDYRSKRLLVTESARINSEAKLAGYKKSGTKYFQYVAVMDSRTTNICIRHDLKVYRVDKAQTGLNMPPLHVNCRSSTKGYYIDDRTGQGTNYPPPVSPPVVKKKVNPIIPPPVISPPVVRPAPKTTPPQQVQTGSLPSITSFGGVHDQAWDKMLVGITPKARAVVALVTQPDRLIKVGKGQGSYSRYYKYSKSPQNNRGTFWHEYGHSIDNRLGADDLSYISTTLLKEARIKDTEYLKLSGLSRGLQDMIAGDLKKELYDVVDVFYKRGRYKGRKKGSEAIPKKDHYRQWSDIYDSLSLGMMHRNYMHGHGVKYYTRGKHERDAENFANLFKIFAEGGEAWSETKIRFPNLSETFEQIMDQVIDGTLKG